MLLRNFKSQQFLFHYFGYFEFIYNIIELLAITPCNHFFLDSILPLYFFKLSPLLILLIYIASSLIFIFEILYSFMSLFCVLLLCFWAFLNLDLCYYCTPLMMFLIYLSCFETFGCWYHSRLVLSGICVPCSYFTTSCRGCLLEELVFLF